MTTSFLPECGYRIEPFLGPEEIAALAEFHDRVDSRSTLEHRDTIVGVPAEKRREVFEGIRNIIAPRIKTLAPGYRLFTANFVTKKPNSSPSGGLGLHPDPASVNLDEAVGVNGWIPLCDVDRTNGCMQFVQFSPRVGHIRALPPFNPSPYDSIHEEIQSGFLTPVPQAAGTACLFDTRTLHATDANRSPRPRVAILMSLIPEGKPACLYFWNPEVPDRLQLYEVDQEFVLNLNPMQYPSEEVRSRARFIADIDYAPRQMTLDEFEQLVPRPAHSQSEPQPPVPPSGPRPSPLARIGRLFSFGAAR